MKHEISELFRSGDRTAAQSEDLKSQVEGLVEVLITTCGSQPQARLLHLDRSFWLEALPGGHSVCIDGTLLSPGTLAPLSPGMQVLFGTEVVRFDRPAQLDLD